ncbi:MAG TPA: hypothetical protein PLH98_13740 [Ruminococcus flavefaciens]|nr:hypothetical protein [Ruminococcus flavefaciens]
MLKHMRAVSKHIKKGLTIFGKYDKIKRNLSKAHLCLRRSGLKSSGLLFSGGILLMPMLFQSMADNIKTKYGGKIK